MEEPRPHLLQQVADLKTAVADAAAHPFLPAPARDAITRAGEAIESIAVRVQRVEDMLAHQLDVHAAAARASTGLYGPPIASGPAGDCHVPTPFVWPKAIS